MHHGTKELVAAFLLIFSSIALDVTSKYSPVQLGQLVVSFILAIAGAFVGFKGLFDFLSTKF